MTALIVVTYVDIIISMTDNALVQAQGRFATYIACERCLSYCSLIPRPLPSCTVGGFKIIFISAVLTAII